MQILSNVNQNFIYILTVIEMLNKFAGAIPNKKKTGEEIMREFSIIFRDRENHQNSY